MKKNAGDKIKVENASWSFGKKVPKNLIAILKNQFPYIQKHMN